MIKRGRRGEAPSLTTYSITLKVKWQREPPLSTQWRRRRQRGCLQAPAFPPSLSPSLEAVIIFRFDVITVGANLHVDCRLSTPLRVHRYADGATAAGDTGGWMLASRKAERETSGVAGRRRKRFPVVFVAPAERETEGGDCRTWK